jgi:hypothetical protein
MVGSVPRRNVMKRGGSKTRALAETLGKVAQGPTAEGPAGGPGQPEPAPGQAAAHARPLPVATPAIDHVRPLARTAGEMQRAIWDKLGPYLGAMEEAWGAAPGIVVRVEARMMVTVDFQLANLPHNGRRFFVNPDNQDTLTPEAIARHVAKEVYEHAATCPGCGHGQPTIQERLRRRINTPPTELEEMLYPKLARLLRERFGNPKSGGTPRGKKTQ